MDFLRLETLEVSGSDLPVCESVRHGLAAVSFRNDLDGGSFKNEVTGRDSFKKRDFGSDPTEKGAASKREFSVGDVPVSGGVSIPLLFGGFLYAMGSDGAYDVARVASDRMGESLGAGGVHCRLFIFGKLIYYLVTGRQCDFDVSQSNIE